MFVTINGLRTHYKLLGEGSPILLLHGWGARLETFAILHQRLSQQRRVYALDLPGFGNSELPSRAWDVADYARFVVDFMNKMDLTSSDLLGHSFGGRVAIKISVMYSHRIRRLILIDSAGVRSTTAGIRIGLIGFVARGVKPITFLIPVTMRTKLRRRFYARLRATDYLMAGRLSDTFKKVVSEDLEPILSNISAHTLLLWGENDHDTPLSDGEIMAKKIPSAKLVVLRGAGHFSFVEQPSESYNAIETFLEATTARV